MLLAEAPQRTQNSRIHAKIFRNSRIHASFSGNSRKPDFSGNRGNFRKNWEKFSKIGEICTNLGEKRKFTRSRKKQGRFTHSRNRKMDFHVHASLFNSRIHAIFFRFSRIHATKKAHSRIHANRWGGLTCLLKVNDLPDVRPLRVGIS